MQRSPLGKADGQRGPLQLSAFALKLVAILAMTVDHAALTFVPVYYSPLGTMLHTVGRLTAPIMFYFVVEGYHHTRSKNRYTLRMALFALVSLLPYIWFTCRIAPFSRLPQGAEWLHLNVIYTLLLGLLALRLWHELRAPALVRGLLTLGLLVLSLPASWSYTAVLAILLFDLYRGDFKKQAAAFAVLVALQLMPVASNLYSILLKGAEGYDVGHYLRRMAVTLGILLPLALLWCYNGQRGGKGRGWERWLFYLFYPAHLLVLAWPRAYTGL